MTLLNNVLMIAADTTRSKAYAYALSIAGIKIQRVLFMEKMEPGRADGNIPPSCDSRVVNGVYLPDLKRSFIDVCEEVADSIDLINCDGIKDPQVEEYLQTFNPALVIYSGFGGEIVPARLLSMNIPFLHIHAGWLPDYRGSTTVYYSLLQDGLCGVSAILLDPKIDNGPIVAQHHYPPPPPGVDVDYLYDNAIRADLLVRVLSKWLIKHNFDDVKSQIHGEGETYYVIHPVLKHLALIGLEQGTIQTALAVENDMQS